MNVKGKSKRIIADDFSGLIFGQEKPTFLVNYSITKLRINGVIQNSNIHDKFFKILAKYNVVFGFDTLRNDEFCLNALTFLNTWKLLGYDNLFNRVKTNIDLYFVSDEGEPKYTTEEITTFVGHLWTLIDGVSVCGSNFMAWCRNIIAIESNETVKTFHADNLAVVSYLLSRLQYFNNTVHLNGNLYKLIFDLKTVMDLADHIFDFVNNSKVDMGINGVAGMLMADKLIEVVDSGDIDTVFELLFEESRKLAEGNDSTAIKNINYTIGRLSVVIAYLTGACSLFTNIDYNPLIHLQQDFYNKSDYLVRDHLAVVNKLVKEGHQFHNQLTIGQ